MTYARHKFCFYKSNSEGTPFHVHICLYSTNFVFCPFLALASEFLLHSLISLVVVPDGYCYVFLGVQDTSRKIVTCPIMYLPCSRHIHSFSNVSACTYIFSLIFMHTYFASTNLVLCIVFINKYSV